MATNKRLLESTKIIIPKINPVIIPKITIPKFDPVLLNQVQTYNDILRNNAVSYESILDNLYSDGFIEDTYDTQESKDIIHEFRETVNEVVEDSCDLNLQDISYSNLTDIEKNALLTAFVTVFEMVFSDAINEYFNNEQFVNSLILLQTGINLILATYNKSKNC
ncbi:hypothetical protein ACN5ZK_13400 (plasmid) [Macrococcoides bohemicum]|uniref:hypothetical protein n=1 Tax=Macrococcoides bohemicum TaxID=1903056 RepID=UPI003B007088